MWIIDHRLAQCGLLTTVGYNVGILTSAGYNVGILTTVGYNVDILTTVVYGMDWAYTDHIWNQATSVEEACQLEMNGANGGVRAFL